MGGFIALALQASVIGWIPAVIWAWKIVHRPEEIPLTKPKAETPVKKTSPRQRSVG